MGEFKISKEQQKGEENPKSAERENKVVRRKKADGEAEAKKSNRAGGSHPLGKLSKRQAVGGPPKEEKGSSVGEKNKGKKFKQKVKKGIGV